MIDKTLYCETHVLSVVGRDSHGSIYQRCWQGKKNLDNGVDQKCVIKIAKDHTPEHQVLEDGSCVQCEFKAGDMGSEVV